MVWEEINFLKKGGGENSAGLVNLHLQDICIYSLHFISTSDGFKTDNLILVMFLEKNKPTRKLREETPNAAPVYRWAYQRKK